MSPVHLKKEENKLQRELFLWYFDRWLPVAAGKKWWRDEIKFYHYPTDTQNVGGEQKINVTVTSAAYGLLSYENYQQKWLRQMEYKEKHGADAPLPKSKEDKDYDGNGVEYYAAKWSDGMAGQVKYGGWGDEGYARFEELKQWEQDLRKADADANKPMQKYALELIQAKNKKKLDQQKSKTKSKRKAQKAPAAPKARKLQRIDE